MAVGIAKVDAFAAIGPRESALDGNAFLLEPLSPRRQTCRGNAEAKVRLAARPVCWNRSKRQDRSVGIAAAKAKQQNLAMAHIESAEALIGFHQQIAKQVRVKFPGSIQVLHVKTTFH